MDRNKYGATETNGLVNGTEYHASVDYTQAYSLADVQAEGGRISRVRLLTEWHGPSTGRVADVSYIHAELPGGKIVPVRVSGECFLIPMNKIKAEFIAWAKREGVYAKGIGLLDEGNWSVLR